jgi:hypothetical protein
LYAAKGAFLNDADTLSWRLVGDPAPPQTFNALGVSDAGWTVISTDPNNPDLAIADWATANALLEETGGNPTNYDRLDVGDPETNAGTQPFPKNTPIDDNNFVLKATGTLVVPAAGTYVIGFNSDDGAYMKITGGQFVEIVQNATGLSYIDGENIICECLTGDSGTLATIELAAGNYPIEVGMFEQGGGAYVRARGGQQGSPSIAVLAKGGAGSFTTASALRLTNAPTGTVGGDAATVTVSRSGNTLTIQWAPTGGTLESATSVSGPWTAVGTANPATITIGTGSVFYRVAN